MALDAPPAATAPVAANATAEHEAAGGDFDAAMAAALADDTAEGVSTDTETAEDVNAPVAEAKADDKPKGDEPAADPELKATKDKDGKPEPQKLRESIEAEVKAKLRGEFSALARDRSKLRERETGAAATEQRAKIYEQKAQSFDVLVSRLIAGDVSVLHQLGAPGDEVINKLLDGVVASAKSPAEVEVARLKADLERRDAEAKAREQQTVVETWKASVRQEVAAAAETFDLVNSLDQHDAVIATIEAYYAKYNGAILPVADAAQAVEDTLAKGLAKSKKFGARAPGTNAQPSKGDPAPSGRKPGSLTLSSVHSSEVPASGEDDLPLDNPQERFRRVMAGLS
jgi:hypothetical protein